MLSIDRLSQVDVQGTQTIHSVSLSVKSSMLLGAERLDK